MTKRPTLIEGDCLEIMREFPDGMFDLVFTSPPYEDARTYGIDCKLKGQDWVDWAVERYMECLRISKGLVAWVVEGRTRQFRWSATPALFMADLHRKGVKLRKPPIYARSGIPGSGGPDWLRNDYEFIVCASHGRLPWSDNTAMGHEPKYAPGGDPSHRLANGRRCNLVHTKTMANGEKKKQGYVAPERANPGNFIDCSEANDVIECIVGGGAMGSRLCHENEAPFPEKLAEFFIRSFCPPDGIVLDPFSGSATTAAVAYRHGREAIGIDLRASQIDLGEKRLQEAEEKYLTQAEMQGTV